MSEEYNQVLVQNVKSVVPNSTSITLNNVSSEHTGWFSFAEIETKYFISRVLSKDSVCIDIGANVGMYSLLFLQLSPSSKVIAFEPSSNFKYLQENIPSKFSDRFEAFQVALGDKDGIVEGEIWESYGYNKIQGVFKFHKLDTFVEQKRLSKIDIIKIDTDGYELQILNGAKTAIENHHPLVIVESHEGLESGQSFEKMNSFFKEIDYSHCATVDGSNEIYAFSDDERIQKLRKMLSRNFLVKNGVLGQLNSFPLSASHLVLIEKLKIFLSFPSKFLHPKFFFANKLPWSYSAISNVINSSANFAQISGLILGQAINLLGVCKDNSNLFSISLHPGYYSKVLIPLINLDNHSEIRLVVRSALAKKHSIIIGLKIDLLSYDA
jgi:FkbM family methyltransferase